MVRSGKVCYGLDGDFSVVIREVVNGCRAPDSGGKGYIKLWCDLSFACYYYLNDRSRGNVQVKRRGRDQGIRFNLALGFAGAVPPTPYNPEVAVPYMPRYFPFGSSASLYSFSRDVGKRSTSGDH